MTPAEHKVASWKSREQPYTRPRFSPTDTPRAVRDAEWDEAYERAGKWVCVALVAVLLTIAGLTWWAR